MCGRIGHKRACIHFIPEHRKINGDIYITSVRHRINITAGNFSKTGKNRPYGFLEIIGLIGPEETIHATRSLDI